MFNISISSNTLQYDPALCIGCSMCSIVCPHAVFEMAPRPQSSGRIAQLVRAKACMECGACQLNCPTGAIVVESGVGCAQAMINAALRGKEEPTCGRDDESDSCCDSPAPAEC
jgi:NAD-dependent dihydropyrimidine dehydrogenase PreA subunit